MPVNSLELTLQRQLHAGATCLAARAWSLLTTLQGYRVWMPYPATLQSTAAAIYYNSSYDACENYADVEEFAESLNSQLVGLFPVVKIAGEEALEVRPFFGKEATMLRHMGLGSLSPNTAEASKSLDATVFRLPDIDPALAICGLTEQEVDVVSSYYHRNTLKLVNALRNLRTELHYVERALADTGCARKGLDRALKADAYEETLAELVNVTTLPFEPAPPKFFSSDDKTLRLSSLKSDAGNAHLASAYDAS